eukprot:TRINITY_DN876_c0_g3_i1.p1 TRINITY_DN876_c0_g3~~TRINITY_DN876_c0_g3_i1.p1  ORF type:complete len:467 (+),score=134.78 TRINITY_DN876_c0_g3_i1:31-1401(+)
MKRAAESQLTREQFDAGTDDAGCEKASHFERAAPDVLAKRRILKVRRGAPTQPPQCTPAKPNPFASLQVHKPIANATATAATAATAAREAPAAEAAAAAAAAEAAPSDKVEDAAAAAEAGARSEAAVEGDGSAAAAAAAAAASKRAHSGEHDAATQTRSGDGNTASAHASHSAKAESALKNGDKEAREAAHSAEVDASDKGVSGAAAAAAAVGTDNGVHEQWTQPRESASANANGSAVAREEEGGQKDAGGDGDESKRSLVVSDGKQAEAKDTYTRLGSKPGIMFGASGSSNIKSFATVAKGDACFKFEADNVAAPTKNTQTHEFKEQPAHSGEEEEDTLFRVRAKLYSLEGEADKMRWRECGVGALKMNQHKENERVRLLMRSEGVLRVVLNTPLVKQVKLDRATERSIRFQGYEEGSSKCYLLRFATRDACAEFIAAVDKWKESLEEKREIVVA